MFADPRDKNCGHCARLLWTQIRQSRQCGTELSAILHITELRRHPTVKALLPRESVLFAFSRNSTRDPETLQPRHLRATLDMGSVALDRPRPWHLTLRPGCTLSSVLTSYELFSAPSSTGNRVGGIVSLVVTNDKAALDWGVAWINYFFFSVFRVNDDGGP